MMMVFNLKDLSFASTPLLAAKANILSDCTLTQPTKWSKDDNRSPYFPPSASLPQHNHLHMSKKTALTRTNTVQGQGPSQLQEWRKTVAPLDSPIASWPILAFENLQAFAFAAGEAVFSTEFPFVVSVSVARKGLPVLQNASHFNRKANSSVSLGLQPTA